jgi:hypothetical protein
MRRSAPVLVTALALAAGGLTTVAPPAAGARVAKGACGWESMAALNPPEELRAGTLTIRSYAPVRLNLSGNVNWRADPYRDSTWRLGFHSLKWMEGLLVSGDPADLALARAIVADFVADNPDPGAATGSWVEPATAFRTSVLLCLRRQGAGDPALVTWLDPILRTHVSALIRRYAGTANHGTIQSLALLAAGCVMDVPAWRTKAAARISDELAAAIDSQGAITEQATFYAPLIWRLFAQAGQHLKACEMPAPSGLAKKLAGVDTFSAHATRPGGTFVEIGDSWPTRPSGLGPNTDWVATGGQEGVRPAGLVKVYNAGYVFARDSWTSPRQYYTLRFGPRRYAHGHHDHLGVTYWAAGRDVLVDSGFDGYRLRAFRLWARSPAAHNVVVVRGTPFRASAHSRLVGRSAGRGAKTWQVRDRAYTGAERHRTVLVDDVLPLMLVRDDVTTSRARELRVLWHLDPSWRKERVTTDAVGTRVTFLSPDGRLRATVLQLSAPGRRFARSATKLIKGRYTPAQGFVSRHRGDRTPNWVIQNRHAAATAASVVTLILVTPVATRIAGRWLIVNGQDRIRVKVGAKVRRYDSTRRGEMSPR